MLARLSQPTVSVSNTSGGASNSNFRFALINPAKQQENWAQTKVEALSAPLTLAQNFKLFFCKFEKTVDTGTSATAAHMTPAEADYKS